MRDTPGRLGSAASPKEHPAAVGENLRPAVPSRTRQLGCIKHRDWAPGCRNAHERSSHSWSKHDETIAAPRSAAPAGSVGEDLWHAAPHVKPFQLAVSKEAHSATVR